MALSDKRKIPFDCVPDKKNFYFYPEQELKEAIKELHKRFWCYAQDFKFENNLELESDFEDMLKEIFGEKLT